MPYESGAKIVRRGRRLLCTAAALLALVIVVSAAVLFMPASFNHPDARQVSEIELFSGQTGRGATITDAETIERVCDALGGCSLRVDGVSLWRMGYGLRVTVTGSNGEQTFYINSSGSARRDPFFYAAEGGMIDYDYLVSLTEE